MGARIGGPNCEGLLLRGAIVAACEFRRTSVNFLMRFWEGKRTGQRPDSKSGAPKGVVGSNPMPSALTFLAS